MNLFKNLLFKSAILSLLAFTFVSCSDDNDNDDNGPWKPSEGLYILNEGSYNGNNANLAFYNLTTQELNKEPFETMNDGLFLGSTAQHLLVQNDTMYIAVYQSAYIFVTDKYGKVIKKIESTRDGQPQQPREFAAHGKYVYVTYYDGYLARINKKTLEIEDQVKVGSNPESVCVSNGKIYVANSGYGYGTTVSKIDLNTFEFIKDIDVIQNPTVLEKDKDGNIYVISMGNYGDIKNTLQKIDIATEEVSVLGKGSIIRMNTKRDKLYSIYSQWGATEVTYKVYDTTTGEVVDNKFITDDVEFVSDPYSLSIDPKNGNIYIGVSNYSTESSMYIISPSTGKLLHSFKTGGISPRGVYFIK
ncbi:hypothetical protein D0T53_03805 [Dysgonomonas sp. 216]|uniref:DUF5074 domain-containing protein n=1 Tax=Dysgonomonas sp. 216 TaxID=2302934 RepID=UPI0013D2BAE3|nr:DUF5074 domain-containing protein [Dysgonomonas sp. 216]NDW18041.1 hypothetical protein [Dysgonomonas sp. 216]